MEKIVFENLPSTKTPLNAENLNQLQENIENAMSSIVESGSNDNGNYIKFENGIMMCFQNVIMNVSLTSGGNNAYYARVDSGIPDYPQPFTEVYYANVTVFNNNISSVTPYNGNKEAGSRLNKIAGTLYFYSPGSSEETAFVQIMAIGKWK